MEKERRTPFIRSGDITVWDRQTSKGIKIYDILESPQEGAPKRTHIFAKFGSHDLTPKEAFDLYRKKDVVIKLTGQNGPYNCTIVNRGINKEENTIDDTTYENRCLKLGVTYHLYRKNTQEHFGYRCDGVNFFKKVNREDTEINLSATDCWRLRDNKKVIKDSIEIKMSTIEVSSKDNTEYQTARLSTERSSERIAHKPEEPYHVSELLQF